MSDIENNNEAPKQTDSEAISEDQAISETEAVSENEAISENEASESHAEQKEETVETESYGDDSSEDNENLPPVEIPNLAQIIEGAVLAADKPLSIDHMIQLFPDAEPSRAQVREAIEKIEANCEGRGFEFKQVASGYRFQVRGEYGEWIGRLWEEKPPRYTRALLETLALIAYKQPITRGDIEEIRGVAVSTNIIRTLLEREWIRIVGHRDVPGRPSIFATTKTFLDYFDLSSLDQLPTLSEIKDLDKVNEELNLEGELIEPRSLVLEDSSDEIEATEADDASLNEVTERVNTIQENIKNLFKEPEPEDHFDDWDDEQAESENEPTQSESDAVGVEQSTSNEPETDQQGDPSEDGVDQESPDRPL